MSGAGGKRVARLAAGPGLPEVAVGGLASSGKRIAVAGYTAAGIGWLARISPAGS
jgi:hypothetical protein